MDESIVNDLALGETPILLVDLPRESFMPKRRGKALHKTIPFRWAHTGKQGVRLESLKTPSGAVTTRSAVLRFFARISDPAPQSIGRSPAKRQRDVDGATRRLAADGIGA